MATATVAERVTRIIAEQLGRDEEDVKPESHLADDLGADSLDDVEIIMALEDEFEIEIEDAAAEAIRTVQQVIDHITAKVTR